MIEVLPATGSTNADLTARLRAGELVAEGRWLIADRQTSGRGRQGREWFDGAGNFMGSTAVRLHPGDPQPGTLALLAGLAVHEAVSPFIPVPHRAMLKWPNDVLVDGAKLAGILLEREGDAVIVGIGVNLASAPDLPDRATTALSAFAPAPDRDDFASKLARQFDIDLQRWRSFGIEPVISRWLACAHPIGTLLSRCDADAEPLTGEFDGLSHDGALQLRLPDGTRRTVHAGEFRLAAS